jgi:hypothetical protein
VVGADAAGLEPKCFVLADQCFPPALPAGGGGEVGDCLAIILIENAHPGELVAAFLELTRGYDVPIGTVVVLSCLSHLGRVGTAAYAADIVRAFGRVHGAVGKNVRTVHGFPLLRGEEGAGQKHCQGSQGDWALAVRSWQTPTLLSPCDLCLLS